ncbi:MAG: M56 family metallopeptidase [Actinomycetota bacterium]|nr:M56 family metallopeptidase [Actinomycetota bacterium]
MPASAERRSLAGARARWLYALTVAVGSLGMLATAEALVAAYRSVQVRTTAGNHLSIVGLHLTYPRVNAPGAVILLLACFGVVAIVRGCAAAVHLVRSQRQFFGQISVLGVLGDQGGVAVFDDVRPQAFCAGYFRPCVYVSTATVDALDPAEMQAVLAHENEHRERGDPMRLASARVLSHALFFLPVLHRLVERYAELAEMRADAAAVLASGGDRAPLASALLAFGDETAPGVGIAPGRVDHLLGQPIASQVPRAWTLLAVLTLGLIAAATVVTSEHASTGLTLNLPLLSRQPCVLVFAALPLAAVATALTRLQAGRREHPADKWVDVPATRPDA